jgi:hypothetical protein
MSEPPVIQQIQDALLSMLADTSRHVDILSTTLEPLVLDNEAVAGALTQLARRGRNTRIRMIVADLRPLLDSGHHLLALSRRLSTAMTLQLLPQHSEWQGETLILCDRSQGMTLKLSEHRWRALHSPAEANSEAERFDRLWLASEPSPELRQF